MRTNLRGQRVLLSAGYPNAGRDSRYLQIPDASRRIAEAVVPLASLLIANGAELVYGGHPSITRLLAGVVSNFGTSPRGVSETHKLPESSTEQEFGRVVLYQVAAFTAIGEVDWLRLSSHVTVAEIPVDSAESNLGLDRSPLDYPKTLQNLRNRMLTDARPTAMVCIGGMEGVQAELKEFTKLYPRLPAFAYATTGGASQLIATDSPRSVTVPDRMAADPVSLEKGRDEWKFTAAEISELGPYTSAAFEVMRILAAQD